MSKVSAAAIAATGVGGSGAAALGVYGMGYFGDGTGSGVNFNNPKHKELLGAGHTWKPFQVPLDEQITPTNTTEVIGIA